MTELKATKRYLATLSEIEDFIKANPNTPAPHPNTGDQSWPFGNGRYRIFIKVVKSTNSNLIIYLLDLIDNRMLNINYYPKNILTYEEE